MERRENEDMPENELRPPVAAIVIGALGSLPMAAGIIGLLDILQIPQLAQPDVAWGLIAVGLGMEIYCVVEIMKRAIAAGRERNP